MITRKCFTPNITLKAGIRTVWAGLFWATLEFDRTWYIWTLVSALFHPSERLGAPLVLARIA